MSDKDKNLIPFDLEAAKRGEPIMYRDGTSAKFVAHVPEVDEHERLITLYGKGYVRSYESGLWQNEPGSTIDLFMAPKPIEQFLNVYAHGVGNYPKDTLEDAKCCSSNQGLSVCKLTILNGEVIAHETVHTY